LSVAMGVPGKGFWTGTAGPSGTQVPLSASTPFHALSLGKIFSSTIVLKLAEEGLLQLDGTIEKWFPGCPRADEITINHLLGHTSGIQTYEALHEFRLRDQNRFTQQQLVEMAFEYPIREKPGTIFSYSNTGYVMLGMIAGKVLGKTWPEICHHYLIQPLALKNTRATILQNLDMAAVKGYEGDQLSEQNEWPLTYAAAPLISTPTDLLLLYDFILNGSLLNNTSLSCMFASMNIWLKAPNAYYGKGIYVFQGLPAGSYLGHSGAYGPFRTCLYYNIENKLYISVFSNSNASEIETAMFYLSEKMVELLANR
jgi:D-alanyl-D-alanine carboxypeptidase